MSKAVVFATTVKHTRGNRRVRLIDCGLLPAEPEEWDGAQQILDAGQVLVIVDDKSGVPVYIAGFKKMSAVGKAFQKLCRPTVWPDP